MRPVIVLGTAFVVGTLFGAACGPVREVGPTALVLEVYFNEARGTKALLISGTAEVDGVPVNVFPTSQRPEALTGAAFPVPQTVRVLLNDSRGGTPVEVTVIGLNADGEAVEAATQTVTPVTQRETLVTLTLRPFADSVEPDAGLPDAGVFDADGGRPCQCDSGCCNTFGTCAPARVPLGSGTTLNAVYLGAPNQVCTGVCPLGRADTVVNGTCRCGSSSACGDGLRCLAGRCVCDQASGCRGCCSSGTTCSAGRIKTECGSGGVACGRCEALSNVCLSTGRCSQNMCTGAAGTCCSGTGSVESKWPTCTGASGDCVACDPLRSNACRVAAVGGNSSPCACGAGNSCTQEELCLFLGGQAVCRRSF
ncbi:MAG: hypothetical protein SFW67_18810 [Myxococcaceae bacterium]|nr:hypothetical protein [Myxococcaceae bacterium]